jgi:ADP-heptose:LPS heptosyltransferase
MKSPTITSILLRRDDNLGDCVVALPVVRELRRNFPKAYITLMVKGPHRPVFYGYANGFLDPLPSNKLLSLRNNYDLIVDVELRLPKNYRPKKINSKNQIIHVGVPDWSKPQHVYRSLLESLRSHGLEVVFSRPKMRLEPGALDLARQWAAANSVGPERLNVAINPGSGFAHKRWPLSRFVKVTRWLQEEYRARIVIVASSGDADVAQRLFKSISKKNSILLRNEPVDIVASILTHLDLFIGNDSGIAHVAAAVGLPTVTIFGPTSPSFWRPLNNKSITVFDESVACPGGYEHASQCTHQKCLLGITDNHVIDAINRSIYRYVWKTGKACLDHIRVSPHLRIRITRRGRLLRNVRTGHSCIVRNGWGIVHRLLNKIEKTNSFAQTLKRFPNDKHLVDFLVLHRIIVPASKDQEA